MGDPSREQPRLQSRFGFALLSMVGAGIAILVGGLTLVGWALDITLLKVLLSGGVAMNPATAVAAVCAGVALLLLREEAKPRTRQVGRGIALLVVLGGVFVLVKYLTGWDLGLDVALFRDKLGDNRMAPNTAILFALIGGTLVLLDVTAPLGRWAAQCFLLSAILICLTALVGYTFDVKPLYGVSAHIPMAFNTAVVFTGLTAGILFARPTRGLCALLASPGAGGMLARRLMPAAVAIPWVLGWLRLAGEEAGYYEAGFGVSLMVVSITVLFFLLVWISGVQLNRLDTARGEAEAALQQSASEIRDLYDSAPCGYHSLGPDGTVLAMNRTELRWLGYPEEEVIGRMKFLDFMTEDSRRRFLDNFPRFKEQGEVHNLEFELVRKDGSTFPVLLNATAVRDAEGRYRASRSTLFDLTDRKRAEDAIRLFADVVANIPVGLLIYQLDSSASEPTLRIRTANPDAHALLGPCLDGAIGQVITDVFPNVPPDQLNCYIRVATTGRAENLGEFQYGDERVATRWWAVQAFPLPDQSVGVVFQDISGRKKAEAEVRRLNAELEERVRQRTEELAEANSGLQRVVSELAEANRELAQKNQENEMFVYSVSHDLRSPLVNLLGFSKELGKAAQSLATILADGAVAPEIQNMVANVLDGKMAKSIGFIQTAVMRLSGIIDALLRLSRAGRVEYRWEQVDVGRVVRRVTDAMQGTMSEKQAHVTLGDLPVVRGDATALEQVFANLVGNALTYLDPSRTGLIEVGCRSAGEDGVRTYFVKDNGLGIPEGHQAKIFQAFQRAHPGVGKGEGLGLAIVARVVERHGGKVWVESRAGEGSTFFVALPADPGRAKR